VISLESSGVFIGLYSVVFYF